MINIFKFRFGIVLGEFLSDTSLNFPFYLAIEDVNLEHENIDGDSSDMIVEQEEHHVHDNAGTNNKRMEITNTNDSDN